MEVHELTQRSVRKQAPPKREPQKQPEPTSLEDGCRDRLSKMREEQREKARRESDRKHREEEEAVMDMIYGPRTA